MDIRPLSDSYAVTQQIAPEDMTAIADFGYRAIICNRPDEEIPPSYQAEAMRAAAEAAGLAFVVLPVTHTTLTLELAEAQKDACSAASGPVLAYCASGMRSAIVWALGQAGDMDTDTIVETAASQGYDLSQLRGQLEAIAGD